MIGRTLSLGSVVDLFDPFEPDLFSVLKFIHQPIHVLGEFQVHNLSSRKNEEFPFSTLPVGHDVFNTRMIFFESQMHVIDPFFKFQDGISDL